MWRIRRSGLETGTYNQMPFIRGLLQRLIFAAFFVAGIALFVPGASAQTVVVQGNQRVDSETIRSYFSGNDEAKVNQGVKDLYATGLFSDVKVRREGGRIVVTVAENNVINRVAFEGNSKIQTASLQSEVQSKSRGAYSPAMVQADVQRILDLYKRSGRGNATVTSRTVNLPNGRMDVVFTIDEGSKTGIREINFAGNEVYSSRKLRNLMQTTEMNFMSWFKTSDVYDPEKLAADQELIRRFYLKNGYADFRIVGADVHYDDAKAGYIVTITVDEGAQYRVSDTTVESHIPDIETSTLLGYVRLHAGDVYDGTAVEKSVEDITKEVARRGYAFAQVRPRGDRHAENQTIALAIIVDEGPRVYIERINIRGNTRTRDYVIRREFEVGEGDAYNRVLIDRAERRLNGLGYFKKVKITSEPGSSPDRIVINVEVEDQPTGSFAISGGYSSQDGVIGEVSLTESNFLGRGQFVKVAATYGQHSKGVTLSFTEPYFLGQRMALGFDLFAQNSGRSQYQLYQNWTTGGTIRLGFPITDEITFAPRYSLYASRIVIPNTLNPYAPFDDCTFPLPGTVGTPIPGTPGVAASDPLRANPLYLNNPTANALINCVSNGEASLALKQAQGTTLTSLVGYSLSYNTLDSPKDPHSGIFAELRQDVAGLGGDSHFLRTTGEARYYREFYDDIIGIAHFQAGDIMGFGGNQLRIIDNFNLGPTLVRGFAPNGLGPRDISNPLFYKTGALGGTDYVGASVEVQFPIFGMPREIGIKGAVFADAGTLFGYKGITNFNSFLGLAPGTPCAYTPSAANNFKQGNCILLADSHTIRSSVGMSLIWASPMGPIRFDYAFVLSKARYDVTQAFRFTGGTSF
jgi:outer membrane protein insertion porin family